MKEEREGGRKQERKEKEWNERRKEKEESGKEGRARGREGCPGSLEIKFVSYFIGNKNSVTYAEMGHEVFP